MRVEASDDGVKAAMDKLAVENQCLLEATVGTSHDCIIVGRERLARMLAR